MGERKKQVEVEGVGGMKVQVKVEVEWGREKNWMKVEREYYFARP
jgi:hypothetical protein